MTHAFAKALLVAITVTLLASTIVRADEFAGAAAGNRWGAQAQPAGNAEDSDPTVRNSVRSHGHP